MNEEINKIMVINYDRSCSSYQQKKKKKSRNSGKANYITLIVVLCITG